MPPSDDRPVPHRPGVISLFFVVKAAIFALGCWIWLVVLAIQGGQVSGWHLVATAGAITMTLVAVVLGVRMALQANAADRHALVKKALIEISWNTAFIGNTSETSDNVLRFPTAMHDSGGWATRGGKGGDDRRR